MSILVTIRRHHPKEAGEEVAATIIMPNTMPKTIILTRTITLTRTIARHRQPGKTPRHQAPKKEDGVLVRVVRGSTVGGAVARGNTKARAKSVAAAATTTGGVKATWYRARHPRLHPMGHPHLLVLQHLPITQI
jgi:hypothetical protein